MEECVRKCKRSALMEASSASFFSKRRKIVGSEQVHLPSSLRGELGDRCSFLNSLEKTVAPATSSNCGAEVAGDLSLSLCSDQYCAVSRSSSNVSGEVVKERFRFVDLEAKSSETEFSTYRDNNFSRETTPSSELCGGSEESGEMEPSSPEILPPAESRRRKPPAGKAPPEAEIEDFFALAEKYEQKRFAEKYNYDTVKDAPLEGRYQWVRLKPREEREIVLT